MHQRTREAGAQEGAATDTTPGPSLTVAAVARRLGVAPATLRTWDRRYGLGPSERLAGSHRRYSTSDVSRLLVMRRLTLEGVAPSEAARTALAGPAEGDAGFAAALPSVTEVVDAFTDAVPMAPDPRGLVSAATQFDNAAVRWMLARVHPREVIDWWSTLVQPALADLVERTALEAPGERALPSLTSAAYAELRSRAAAAAQRAHHPAHGAQRSARTVLAIAAAPGSELVVHVLATALQEHAVAARVLSVARPKAVVDAVERLRPAAVVVHAAPDDDDEAGLRVVEAVVGADTQVPVFVHREGASTFEVPAVGVVHRVRSLTGALHEVLAVVG